MPRELNPLLSPGDLPNLPCREVLGRLNHCRAELGFDYEVAVLGISVAALMRVDWVCRKLIVPEGVQRVVIPGWCGGDIEYLSRSLRRPVRTWAEGFV